MRLNINNIFKCTLVFSGVLFVFTFAVAYPICISKEIFSFIFNHEQLNASICLLDLLGDTPPDAFFTATIGFLSALNGIAIPISIKSVSESLKQYNDAEIQNMFFEESVFNRQLLVLILIAIILIIWFFFLKNFITGFIILVLGILSLWNFYCFICKVIEYTTKTDDIVLERQFNNIKKLLY